MSDADTPDAAPHESAAQYLRRIYATNREWYAISESKAQLLFAVNGVFVTVLSGAILGNASDLKSIRSSIGPETWTLLGLTITCVVGAIASAALCMRSYHGTYRQQFEKFSVVPAREDVSGGVDATPGSPPPYPPELLWYFGHIKHLDTDRAQEALQALPAGAELATLSYHIPELSHRIWKKYMYVNAGWAFTVGGLLSLAATAVSVAIRVTA